MNFNGYKLKTKSMSLVVLQGFILEPLHFLIYIDDLRRVSQVFNILMYADDTTLCCDINDTNWEFFLNNELSKISASLSSNKLFINIIKSKFMVFHAAQQGVNYPVLKLSNF